MAPHSGEIVNEAPTAFALLGRRPAVRRWVTARVCSGAAVTLLRASFLWQIYDLTKSPAMLGLTGLLSFVPAPVSSLLGGAIADAVDRRKVILVAQAVALVCALFLTFSDASSSIVPLIALVVTNAAATAFEAPARQAMLPNLVPRDEFARAVTVMATAQSLAFMTGPALAGVLIGHGGVRFAFGVASALYVASIFFVRGLPTNAPTEAGLRGVSVAALREGLTFVLRNRPVLGASTTVEYGMKGLYEHTVGRLAEATRTGSALTPEERFAAKVAQDYVDFIRIDPWYLFDFKSRLTQLWQLPLAGESLPPA